MSSTLDRLVEMNEQIERMMAIERARIEAVKTERAMLQETMTEEIMADLKEFKDYIKKLGYQSEDYETFESKILITIRGVKLPITIMLWTNGEIRILQHGGNERGYWIYKNNAWELKGMCDSVYEYWKTIKRNIEELLIERYLKQQTEKCKELELETIDCLIGLENTKKVLR